MSSRCGGLGGPAARQLAFAGIVMPADLNRQILQSADRLGKPRTDGIRQRLLALNPRLHVEVVDEHANAA